MTRRVVVVDCETTGLDADRHEIWELAAVELRPEGRAEHLWRMEPVRQMDGAALAVGRYEERTSQMRAHPEFPLGLHDLPGPGPFWSGPRAVAHALTVVLADATLVAAVPGFDERFMTALLRRYGITWQPWHYRVRDVQSMALGYLWGLAQAGHYYPSDLPGLDASTDTLAAALGLDPVRYNRHTALGDCRLEADMFDLITGQAGAVLADGRRQ
jgi:DNA polymerase III epsilon subunit-like protein